MKKVKIFDFEHEKDLEFSINNFIKGNNINVLDIKYQVSHFSHDGKQIYSFSALIIYDEAIKK